MGGCQLDVVSKANLLRNTYSSERFSNLPNRSNVFCSCHYFGLCLCAYVFFFPKLYSSVDLQHVCMHILHCTDAGCSSYQSQNSFQYLLTSPKSSDLWGLVPGRCALTKLHGKAIRRNPDQMPKCLCMFLLFLTLTLSESHYGANSFWHRTSSSP